MENMRKESGANKNEMTRKMTEKNQKGVAKVYGSV